MTKNTNTCKFCTAKPPQIATHQLVNRFDMIVPCCTTCYHVAVINRSHNEFTRRTLIATAC